MKLHPNGSIEGTPSEIAEYNKLQMEKKEQFKVIAPVTLRISDYNSPANYVRGLMSAISKSATKEYNTNQVKLMTPEEIMQEINDTDREKDFMKHLVHQLYH